MNKYFGESEKLIRAMFSMCRKLSPCILFIDEVDIFLSSRNHGGEEVLIIAHPDLCSDEIRILTVVGWYAIRRY